MEKNFVKELLNWVQNEKLNMNLRRASDYEFWLEEPYGFLTARFFVNIAAREISYDIFSPKYDLHLKEESLRDVEKLERIIEEKGKWDYEKPIEELWLILDHVNLWAQNNGFSIKEKRIV